MNSIILLGIKHCGKSTQGKLLSKHFGCPFFDTDDEVTALTGKTPREIYSEQGKDAFIEAERNACEKLAEKILNQSQNEGECVSSDGIACVIATGGGICNNPAALEALHKTGKFVFLNADEKTAADRIVREIKYDGVGVMKNLPAYIAKENPENVADVRAIFHNFYEERQKIYKDLCDIEVKLNYTATKTENMEKIIKALG
ncbi:shikimate kinase [uncultured Treponema sp.]|uniref:shikimate kinase n=1 Tax=uncultured Treponema sp. TaxID=162155 RepID=UPI0025F490B5|nr:shikimate kinase [uncultured Treponema sp.]